MSTIIESSIYFLLPIVVAIVACVVAYYKWQFTYWKRVGLEYLEPSIPFGNTSKLFTKQLCMGDQYMEIYNQLKGKGLKHGGVYMLSQPIYVPVDPVIVKHIMQTDFQHFVDRGFYVNEEADPLTGHIFSLEGTKWKNLRAKLTSTFTSGRMKMMFETVVKCTEGLDVIMLESSNSKDQINTKDIMGRFTTDVISSVAFGLESNSLKNPDNDFRKCGQKIFENTTWENFKNFMQFSVPRSILNMVGFRTTKKEVEDFIMDIVNKTVDYRERENIYRKDFLHLLLQLKNRGELSNDESIFAKNGEINGKDVLKLNELAAQVFAFFAAGFETSSTLMTFTLYELCKNQEIQEKVRNEIETIIGKHGNKLTYEAVMEMTYMDEVLNESLRKYPPLPFLNRVCTIPYDVPGTKIHLEKDTRVFIPIQGIHKDPEFYPEPEKFDPERFNAKNKNSRGPGLTYMPFGEGPRICIGLRFGLMQAKVGLVGLLRNYKVTLSSKTKEPLRMDPTSLIMSTDTTIWLNVSKIPKI